MKQSNLIKTIRFREINEDFGFLSNFYYATIRLKGKDWITNEHYYQAQKFAGTPYEEEIRLESAPRYAKWAGQSTKHKLRADWESVKYSIMKDCNRAKYNQHPHLKQWLLDTGSAHLIEDAPWDEIWGCGKNDTGLNWQGQILMELREEFSLEK